MKLIAILTSLMFALPAFAKVEDKNGLEYVTGESALQDHYINQYDDVDQPPQGYVVTLPKDYYLMAVDVDGGDSAICGIEDYKYGNPTFKISGFSLETDEQGCTVTLKIGKKGSEEVQHVKYSIEQVGT